ncbi:disease resistance protein RUN1-like isoform X2 [Juglans regia]|uniref:Disease resistance protein RUN1-like isoform X2 n=1 Tax=Juglans regia TaxID=51240 RepID=A0A6P9EBM9_JUGRE|nr:disease resistance protein RUN1-like isoform X2 [Juglans regia]
MYSSVIEAKTPAILLPTIYITIGIGKPISPELLLAIENSSVAVVVLSKNFAFSVWCLQELARIIECMKERKMTVLPIFYHVDPSDVRHQRGFFAQAFAKHEISFEKDLEKVRMWRNALREVGNHFGFHLQDGPESKFIKFIVHHLQRNVPMKDSPVASSSSNVQKPPSSLSSSCSEWEYDVFLSFRSTDTRNNFTDHLFEALVNKGIRTFMDINGESRREEWIAPEISSAMEKSRMAVIVFSQHYAHSRWCLQELSMICECMKEKKMVVLPIFYHVDPSEVRHQRGNFGDAFERHGPFTNIETMLIWRDALHEVTNLSGFKIEDGSEAKFIRTIVEEISLQFDYTLTSVAGDDLVGMNSRLEEMNLHLDLASNDVRFIGICGMSGIGKTTLARVVFVRILHKFEASRFLENVREVSKSYGLAALQEQLLYNMKFKSEKDAWNVHKGIHAIRSRLCRKKVLIVLDDVDTEIQLQMLAGNREWFGPGSRIIITTTNRYLLARHGVQDVCLAKQLNESDALQLFIWKAFGKPNCGKEFLDLSKDFVNYAKGLPSTIKNLGCSLYGKSIEQWIVELDNLKAEAVDRNSEDADRFNFDGLWDTEKELFLDIACFFNGEDKDRVVDILDNSGCFPNIGIEVLKEKSFITIVGKKLWMHDSLRKVGWEIVRNESPMEAGRRSRLWLCEDVLNVLKNNKGTNVVESIVLDSLLQKEELNAEAFLEMKRLRLLKICNVLLPHGLDYLSNELLVIDWHGYPLKSLPRSFQPNNLVELIMRCSHIKQLPKGFISNLYRLKLIDLSDSQNFNEIPNFDGFPNLERLILQRCTSLCKIDPSIRALNRLILLDLEGCKCLYSLPPEINFESLETFILSGCSALKKFPEIGQNMTRLSKLYLDGSAVEKLPLSFKHLSGLTLLNLRDCKNFSAFPDMICSLTSLQTLNLSGFECRPTRSWHSLGRSYSLSSVRVTATYPQIISFLILFFLILPHGHLSFLVCATLILWAYFFFAAQLPELEPINFLLPRSFSRLSSLVSLDLSDCNLLDGALPDDLDRLSSLHSLNLGGNNFTRLPERISQLPKLKILYLDKCGRLQSIPKLPLCIQFVMARECASLENYSSQGMVWTSGEEGFITS